VRRRRGKAKADLADDSDARRPVPAGEIEGGPVIALFQPDLSMPAPRGIQTLYSRLRTTTCAKRA
jgi:hypothetical protein